jgi:hypothetical protein
VGVVDIRIFDAIPQFGDFRNILAFDMNIIGEIYGKRLVNRIMSSTQ